MVTLPGARIPFYRELRFGLPMVRTLMHRWRRQRPDVVQVVTEGPLGWAAVSAAKKLNLPVVTEFHTNFHAYSNYYRLGLISKIVAKYLKYFHNRLGQTLVPTLEMKQRLGAEGYQDLSVVGRGIDPNLFNPERRNADLRASWGLKEGDRAVIYVGRIAPEKNIALALEAFEAMRRRDPRLVFVAVGDGPARPQLEQQYPHVIFAGMRKGEDLASHYASGDIFLFPSVTETFGNVVLEAMASGLAIVAFDYAAANLYLTDGVSALLAPFNVAEAFVARAESLAVNPEIVHQLRGEVREPAQACSWARIIADLEAVLTKHDEGEGAHHARLEAKANLVAHGPDRRPMVP